MLSSYPVAIALLASSVFRDSADKKSEPQVYELANIDELRDGFPATGECIYMDHGFWSPLPLKVVLAVDRFMHGRQYATCTKDQWDEKVAEAKRKVAKLINCSMNEIAFTKNTTEGISIAANGMGLRAGDNVILTDAQHPANLYPWLNLRRLGVEPKIIRARGREVKATAFERLIDAHTKAIVVDHVENWYGFKCGVSELGEMCRRHGLLFIVNATQSCGTVPIDVKAASIQMLSFSCFKWLLSPYGVGCFYCDEGLVQQIMPTEVGDRSGTVSSRASNAELIMATDAARFESGNLNYPGVYGLDAALDMILDIGVERIQRKILSITDMLIKGLLDLGLKVMSPLRKQVRSGIVSFSADNPDKIVGRLLENRIYVSVRGGAIRVSPHFYNVATDIDVFLQTLGNMI